MYGEGQMDNGFLAQVSKASSERVEVSWADWGGEGALVKEPPHSQAHVMCYPIQFLQTPHG